MVGQGQHVLLGKFSSVRAEVGQLLLSIWHPGDKGEKAGRTRSLQPSLDSVSYQVRTGRFKVKVRSWFVGQYLSW